MSGTDRARRLPVRGQLVFLIACSAGLTVALAHLAYHYVRLGEGFTRLILH